MAKLLRDPRMRPLLESDPLYRAAVIEERARAANEASASEALASGGSSAGIAAAGADAGSFGLRTPASRARSGHASSL